MTDISFEQLKKAMPASRRRKLTQKDVDLMNGVINNSVLREEFRDSLFNYINILEDGKFKLEHYINAVRYCGFKLVGDTDVQAYVKTFPERYQRLVDEGMEQNKISGYISMYNSGLLITKIMEQSMVPVHIMNMDLHQRAINRLADLMMNAKSEHVQSISAGKLVDVLKAPEVTKIDVSIGLTEDDSIAALRESTMQLVKQQKLMLEAGVVTAKEVAHQKLIRIDVIEAEIVD